MFFWRIFLLYCVTKKLWYSWIEESCVVSSDSTKWGLIESAVVRRLKLSTWCIDYVRNMEIILSVEFINVFFFSGMFARLHCSHWTHLCSSFLCILTVILPFVLHGYETRSLALRRRTWPESFRKRGAEENIWTSEGGEIFVHMPLRPPLIPHGLSWDWRCVGFEVDRIAMLRVFLRVLGFYPVIIIQPVPRSCI